MPSHEDSSATYVTLVRFRYDRGSGIESKQYANAASDVVHSTEGTFKSLTRLGVELPMVDGRMDEKPAIISTIEDVEPVSEYAKGFPHAIITVEVFDAILEDVDGTLESVWFGELTRAEVEPDGSVMLTVDGIKSQVRDRPLGVSCNSTCPWRFGSTACGVDLAPIIETGTIASIDRRVVTISGLTTTAVQEYWNRGTVRLGGLDLLIRSYTVGDVFELIDEPPSYWQGATVEVIPGCDKTPNVCEGRWNNLARFGGVGIAIPTVNPRLQGL